MTKVNFFLKKEDGMSIVPFSRFLVFDKSMEPSFLEGDYILTFNWTTPKKGDVIVFRNGEVYWLKRVEDVNGEYIFVSGDNSLSSKVEPVETKQIVGKVILKY